MKEGIVLRMVSGRDVWHWKMIRNTQERKEKDVLLKSVPFANLFNNLKIYIRARSGRGVSPALRKCSSHSLMAWTNSWSPRGGRERTPESYLQITYTIRK